MPRRNPRYRPPVEFACKDARPTPKVTPIQKLAPTSQSENSSLCSVVIGVDRRFIEASDAFCKLSGYSREQLIGMNHDDMIAPHTAEIGTPNDPFGTAGCSEGLWLLVCREGTRILVHYESRQRIDQVIQIEIRAVGAGY